MTDKNTTAPETEAPASNVPNHEPGENRIEPRLPSAVDRLQRLPHPLAVVLLDEDPDRLGVELAARHAEPVGRFLCRLEDGVRDGDRGFHGESITRVIPVCQRGRFKSIQLKADRSH